MFCNKTIPDGKSVFCFVTAKLKRDLAAAFNDNISGYRNAKDAFVSATMNAARAGR
jgi:hypothetical protein